MELNTFLARAGTMLAIPWAVHAQRTASHLRCASMCTLSLVSV